MESGRCIYLVGFSGAGKSTAAKLIGEALHWPVHDLDQVIVECCGMTVPVIFQTEGEPGFRSRETDALNRVSTSGQCVVATGGGTVVSQENRKIMARTGWIVCLEGHVRTLLARIQRQGMKDPDLALRPMLATAQPLNQIRALKDSRQFAYSLSDWTVHTDRLTLQQVAAEVVRAVDILERSDHPRSIDDLVDCVHS